jgi:hypothetical protein
VPRVHTIAGSGRGKVVSCKRTVTVAQAKRWWARPGAGATYRRRLASDPDGTWETAGRGTVRFVSPRYEHGTLFKCEHGRVVGYGMDDSEIRRALMWRRRRKRRR